MYHIWDKNIRIALTNKRNEMKSLVCPICEGYFFDITDTKKKIICSFCSFILTFNKELKNNPQYKKENDPLYPDYINKTEWE